jgi:DNA-binding CsgD family transcriptional regulator
MHPVTPVGVLAGRADELARLDAYLRDLSRGTGSAVLIEGEPGIGKSTLLRTALERVPSGSSQVFRGAGDELGQEMPLSPFLDAFGVRRPSANARRTTIAGLLRGEVATDRGADVPAMLAEQLIALAIDETTVRPTVLVIDDLQWADQASVKLWGRLARTAAEVPLLLVGLTRPTPQREDLLALRRSVDDDARLQLTALSPAATAELVAQFAGGQPDPELLRLAEGAAGNPLYLTELLAALDRSGGIAVTAAGAARLTATTVPDSLTAAIADRVGFVSGPTREVLRAAALLGVEFDVLDLTTVLGRTVAEVMPALDEASATGVLTNSGDGSALAFRHPLIREALYAELPAAVRGAWHRDAGHALASAGAAPDRVARQLLRALGGIAGAGMQLNLMPAGSLFPAAGGDGDPAASPHPGSPRSDVPAFHIERPPVGAGGSWSATLMDQWMLDWLVSSADSLISQAPAVASELLGQAVEGIPAGSITHGWLASRLADALFRTGDRCGAERVAERALGHASDPDLLVDLHWTLAQCRILGSESDESFLLLHEALDAPGITAKHRGRLLVLAARTYLYRGDVEAAGTEAKRALASAEEAADIWATGWALHVLATMSTIRGDLADALPLYDRALAVAETDPALRDLAILLQINKSVALFNLDLCDEALAVAEQARQQADQVGTAIRLAQAHGVLVQALGEIGRWDEALAEMAVVPEDLKEAVSACIERGIAAVIGFHRNELDVARRHLSAAEEHAKRSGHRTVPSLLFAQALDHEQAGALGAALTVLTSAIDASPDDLGEIEDLLSEAVRLAVKIEDKATAQAITAKAVTLAGGSQIPHQQAHALYCRGLVDQDSAVLHAAAQRYADAGRPLLRAKALEAAAGCLVAADDRTAARQAFEQAVEVYEYLGAEADLNRVQSEFRGYGIRRGPHSKHRRAVSGWDSLTDSELKVAAFVEEGLSNPEIAGRLMLSRRTVATHVSHILKKLNVTTRTDVARESALRAATAR